MKYIPTAVTQVDLEIAEAPYLGGEFQVYLSSTPAQLLGSIEMSNSGNGQANGNLTWAANQGSPQPLLNQLGFGSAADICCVCKEDLTSGVACQVSIDVMDDQNNAAFAVCTFQPPARVADQSYNFPRGYAMDMTVSTSVPGSPRKVKSIVGNNVSVVGGSAGMTFRIYQFPEMSTYVLVGETTSKKFNTKARSPVGIDSGMEADAFVKRGKTGKGDLTIDSKFGSMAERMSRNNGKKTTCMLVGVKEGVLTNDIMVFTQFTPIVNYDNPDGDGEAMENAATGKYVDNANFVAP